jgi:hypothetical protein
VNHQATGSYRARLSDIRRFNHEPMSSVPTQNAVRLALSFVFGIAAERPAGLVLEIDLRELLTAVVAHDEASD